MFCYLNREIIPQSEAKLNISDLTLIRGYGVFDYFLFDDFRPRFLADYLERFFNSAKLLNLESPVSKEELAEGVHELIAANKAPSGSIRLVLTGGYSSDSYTPSTGNLFALQSLTPEVSESLHQNGAKVITHLHQREIPLAKSLSYTTGIWLLTRLKKEGVHYPLYHDGTYLRESDRSNFFMVGKDNHLITPASKILMGITRAKVISLAKELSIPHEIREVEITELSSAKEVFFTSSIKGVMPVKSINGKPVGSGKVGDVTKQLQKAFLELVAVN